MRPEPYTFDRVRETLRNGTSAQELIEQTLSTIEKQDQTLHSFVALDADSAIAAARRIDSDRANGIPIRPLTGVPIAIKDIIDVSGLTTGAGSLTRRGALPAVMDAPVVARLRAAGAVIVGKTHTVEYAFGAWGTNETMGTPLNPRDREHPRAPGGSSSGSAVAVAANLVPAAIGTDTGGSVRIPAAFCGCVGLKTTYGLIDTGNVVPLAARFDTIGPLTNSVADAANLLAVMAMPKPGDAERWTMRLGEIGNGARSSLEGLRVGIISNLGVAIDADTARVFAQTQARLRALGALVEEVIVPEALADLAVPLGKILAIEAYRLYGHFAEASVLGGPIRERMLAGRDISADQVNAIVEHRETAKRSFAPLFTRFDALLAPTTPWPAPLLSEYDENVPASVLTRFANYLDLAALSMPMGLSNERLPIGMQIIVAGLNEPRALEIGAALEADRGDLFSP